MSILSLLVCLAMLLSGASVSETPEAISSRTLTISDLVVSIGDEEFAIDPTLSIGVQTENNAALLDFSVDCGEDALFPIQAKIDESGATILVDDASSAYSFSPEMLGISDIPAEATAMLECVIRMIADIPNIEAGEATANEALTAKLIELTADATQEETTYSVDGADVPATRVQFTLDHEEIMALYDAVIESYTGDFFNAYFELLNQVLSDSVVILDDETVMPEIDSFSDLFALMPMTISLDFDVTATEDVQGEGDVTLKCDVLSDDETVSFELPMHLQLTAADAGTLSTRIDFPEAMGAMTFSADYRGSDCAILMDMQFADDEETISMNLSANTAGADSNFVMDMKVESYGEAISLLVSSSSAQQIDGSSSSTLSYALDGDDGSLTYGASFSLASQTDAQGQTDAAVSLGLSSDGILFGLSFDSNISNAEIADRIADKPVHAVASEEDEALDSLSMSLMELYADVETLMAEPSVAAMFEGVAALFPEEVA